MTVPHEIRNLLRVEEGDELLFYTDEAGRDKDTLVLRVVARQTKALYNPEN